ncbi:MAG: cation transporter [Clostridiales Family XIII bacterium]|jgi:copper chaperone|nr:cation transporter [Clostridiales Family XIII bacterium]
MAKTVVNVVGMSCEHCVEAVRHAVSKVPGVTGSEISLENGTVTLEYDQEAGPLDMDAVIWEIEEQGYEASA